ncbi:hypothetical protein [Streptomyces bacillaris]|uniref:hypothetical protein n=1 Tax=Streptomyces bacillaris TaxID=68179 RepID=UPI0037F60D20
MHVHNSQDPTTRDDVVVTYRWVPRRHATRESLPEHRLWEAASELEFRAFQDCGRRLAWGRERLLDGVSYDFPALQELPVRERETALGLLPRHQPWPWLRSRMRLMRIWATTKADEPVDLLGALADVNEKIRQDQGTYYVNRLRMLAEEISHREGEPGRIQAGPYGFYIPEKLCDEHADNATLCVLLRSVRERGPAVDVVTHTTTRLADTAWERARRKAWEARHRGK